MNVVYELLTMVGTALSSILILKKLFLDGMEKNLENKFNGVDEVIKTRIDSLENHINTKISDTNTKIADIKTDVSQLRFDIKDVKNETSLSINAAKSDLREIVRENDIKANQRITELSARVLRLENKG